MDLSAHIPLIAAGALALVLAARLLRLMPRLCAPARERTRLEMGVLIAIVAVGLLAVYGRFYTGERLFAYADAGSDTIEQYVPFYLNLLDSIREGTFGLWNFDFGLGVSAVSYQSWLLDPFNLVLVPLGLLLGNSALAGILVAVQSLKVALCALAMDAVLAFFCERPLSRILGASVFAFSGYLMLWGQHYWLGSVLVLAIALVLALERLMERWSAPRFLAVAACSALPALMSAYVGFMVLLFAAAYAALRCLARTANAQGAARLFGRLAVPVVCGLAVSCVTLVPYASYLLGESSRVGGGSTGSSLLANAGLVPLAWVPAILSRLLGSSLISSAADIPAEVIPATENFQYVNVYEFIQLGLSCGALILIGQFAHWVVRECDRRTKRLIGIAAALVLLYCFDFFLPALFNALVEPKYRSVFAVTIPLTIAMAAGFDRRIAAGRVALVPLAVCGLASLGVLAWSLAVSQDGRRVCMVYLVVTAVFLAVLAPLNRSDGRRTPALALVLVCACVFSTSILDAYLVTNARGTAEAASFPDASSAETDASTREALVWIREQNDGFYRVEKLYQDWTRFEDSLIQGYAGVSSYNSSLDGDVREFYRMLWPQAVTRGTAYQEWIADPNRPELLRLLGVRYLLSKDELAFDWCSEAARFGDVIVYEVEGADSLLSAATGVVSESDATALTTEERRVLVERGTLIVADDAVAELAGLQLNADVTSSLALVGASTVQGTASASASTAVCLAVPHTGNWTITVDGEEVETFRADYGFIGFTLLAGEHEICARFTPAGLGAGLAIGAAGLAATFASCVAMSGHRRRLAAASEV